jgi:UDP-glucose 4-epimerase
MPTCLVTGGGGFIGSHLATALVERGDRVRVLDNFSTGNRKNLDHIRDDIELTEADVQDPTAVARAVKDAEYVFHQAALASVPRSVERPLDTNDACVAGTVNLLHEARKAGVRRVVYAASSSAYGDQPFASKRETDMPAPLSPYAAAKLAGELYCHAFYHTYGLETVALRYFNVFGPRQDPDSPYAAVIPIFITRLLAGERPVVYGDGHQSRDFTYVANVVDGNLLAAEANGVAGQTLNVANGRSTTLLRLLQLLNQLLGTDIEPVFDPPRAGDVRDSLADITAARNLLGFEPQVTFEEGLRKSIDYYRSVAG